MSSDGDELSEEYFPVVGIGASAGGLDEFKKLLSALPADAEMALIFAQHLAPGHESLLPDLLSKASLLPVSQVVNRTVIRPNNAYVVPEDSSMTIVGGELQLRPRAPGEHLSIDLFLRSLAEAFGERAIGVILSGTGSDGAIGLSEIKAASGITFAQDRTSAAFPGMPESAVRAGCVDFVMPTEAIAAELVRISKGARYPRLVDNASASSEEAFHKIVFLLTSSTGVNFREYRDSTLRRRIGRRIALARKENAADYCKYLENNAAELEALYRDVLINVTSFFRDPELFESLKSVVFPSLIRNRPVGAPIRIWIPGCSTGQEVYSIAIALLEYFDGQEGRLPIQIFGTDIKESPGIDMARAGYYPEGIAEEMSPQRLHRFFTREDRGYRVGKALREMCVFAKHNLTEDPPFAKIDLISCRNVLIYLTPALQEKIFPIFHYSLNATGYLLLGSSETVGRFSDLFMLADPRQKIWMKNAAAVRLSLPMTARRNPTLGATAPAPVAGRSNVSELQREADRIMLTRFAPASVLVNDNFDVLHFRGHTGPFLEHASGQASFSLLKMARENLFLELKSLISEVRAKRSAVTKAGARFRSNGEIREVDLEVIPVNPPGTSLSGYLVLFEEPDRSSISPVAVDIPAGDVSNLQQELNATKDYLHSIIDQQASANDELRSAHEDLMSANEELQSMNEELQTAKEELQSTNEELNTVNEELQGRNTQLTDTNNDLANLLTSVELPIIICGRDLSIRRFTPSSENQLHLRQSDIGRSIQELRLPVEPADFDNKVQQVIATGEALELEILGRDGTWFQLRIHPYRRDDGAIDGATLVFSDITRIKQAEAALKTSRDYVSVIVDAVQDPLLILDSNLRIRQATRAFLEKFELSSNEVEGRTLQELAGGEWSNENLHVQLKRVVDQGHSFSEFEMTAEFPKIGARTMLLSARRLSQGPSTGALILLAFTDLTQRKHLEDKLRIQVDETQSATAAKDNFLAALSHELRTPLTPVLAAVSLLNRGGRLPPELNQPLDVIRRNVALEARLIDDLLDLTRIVRGKLSLQKRIIDIRPILEQALEICRGDAAFRRQPIETDISSTPLTINGDGSRLQQVMWNLMRNAIKFTPEGGRIDIRCLRKDGSAVVEVRDTGIGIPKEVLPRVFDAFEQGDRKITRQFGGLGLGLAIAKRLVELHDGTITAESEGEGRGAVFRVSFPIADLPHPVDSAASQLEGPHPKKGNLHILLVEDNADTADMMSQLLAGEGHSVVSASDFGSALRAAEGKHFDLLISDLGLPDRSGVELVSELEKRGQGMHAIALSGFGQEDDIRKSRAAGFDYHLTKPIDFEVLLSAINTVLQVNAAK